MGVLNFFLYLCIFIFACNLAYQLGCLIGRFLYARKGKRATTKVDNAPEILKNDLRENAALVVKDYLERAGYTVWPYQDVDETGLSFGVNLRWPEITDPALLEEQCRFINTACQTEARRHGFTVIMSQPRVAAGGVMWVLFGFATDKFIAERNDSGYKPRIPLWECIEVEMPKGDSDPR